MLNAPLFRARSGHLVTEADVITALRAVKSHEAEILFVHSGISFGSPLPTLTRAELLGRLHRCLLSLDVPTIVMPTFTFSFCNGLDYDVRGSRSRMGSLNEFFRNLPGTVRSVDPLMSCAAAGRELRVVTDIGHDSCGKDSTFDHIHCAGARARFLFLGVEPAKCMTYTHYVEERLSVPYRYNRPFSGRVTYTNGHTTRDTYNLYVRYQGVTPISDDRFQSALLQEGIMERAPLGDSAVFAISEPQAYQAISGAIVSTPDYFITVPFNLSQVTTDFRVRDMVAL